MAFKPPANLPDYTKLTTSLNASGVQSWNPELHSILKQLISSAQQSQDAITGVPAGSPVGVIDIGGSSSSGSEIEYLGDIALPKVYNDGDIVVGTDGIAYLCTKDGTTTVPTVWPGGGGLTGPAGPQGPPGTIGPHHTTHEPGGSDALVNAAWVNLSNTFTKFQRFKKDVTNSPQLALDGVGGVNTSLWGISTVNGGTQLHFIAFDDDLNSGSSAIQLFRNGNVIITGVLNVSNDILTGGNILVTKIIPEIQLQYTGVTAKVHLLAAGSAGSWLTHNLSFDGTDWNRDDTTLAGGFLTIQQNSLLFRVVPAGGNPATGVLSTLFGIDGTGLATFNGNVLVNGGVTVQNPVPANGNVAVRNYVNQFTKPQRISNQDDYLNTSGESRYAQIIFTNFAEAPGNQKWTIVVVGQQFTIATLTDPETNYVAYPFVLDRFGNASVGADIYEKQRTTPMGHWINNPFVASDYVGLNSGGWTVAAGDIHSNYTLIGKTLIWSVDVVTSTLVAGNFAVQIKLPGGFTAVAPGPNYATAAAYMVQGGNVIATPWSVFLQDTTHIFIHQGGAPIPAGTFATYFTMSIQIN